MAVMIEPRNDDRIDALATQVAVLTVRVDEGFKRMDEGFKRVDERFKRMDERFERMDERFKRMDERFERVDDRFHHMQWTLITIAGAIIVALITASHL